jgi:hypothetical protein
MGFKDKIIAKNEEVETAYTHAEMVSQSQAEQEYLASFETHLADVDAAEVTVLGLVTHLHQKLDTTWESLRSLESDLSPVTDFYDDLPGDPEVDLTNKLKPNLALAVERVVALGSAIEQLRSDLDL